MMAKPELDFPASPWLEQLVEASLAEDRARQDVTSELCLAAERQARGAVTARQAGVLAGLPLLARVFGRLDPTVRIDPLRDDGEALAEGDVVAKLTGPARSLLAGERTALNFLQSLSGIASLTARFVQAVAGTSCLVLDTRKTLPGYRELAKYAVRCGGGHNHRLGLHDRILIKDNHWLAAQSSLVQLVARGRGEHPDLICEIEVDDLEQLQQVLPLDVEWILLDNFTPEQVFYF